MIGLFILLMLMFRLANIILKHWPILKCPVFTFLLFIRFNCPPDAIQGQETSEYGSAIAYYQLPSILGDYSYRSFDQYYSWKQNHDD